MTTNQNYEVDSLDEANQSIEEWDCKIKDITAQIERIKFDKKAAEEALVVEMNRLRLKESELRRVKGLKEVQKIYRDTLIDGSVKAARANSKRKGALTPYKIKGFGSQRGQKKNLHIGDIVSTNKGTGAFAGLNKAKVESALEGGYVQLKLEGVPCLTRCLAINLQHTEFRDK